MNESLRQTVAARLAEIGDPNRFEVHHCSGGDSRLPQELRGETPDVPRLPTVDEVLRYLYPSDDEDAIDSAIEVAAECLLQTEHPAWTDDLAVHLLRESEF